MFCNDLDGWDERGLEGRSKREGIYVCEEMTHFVVQQKLTQHCKASMPQLKKKGKGFPGGSVVKNPPPIAGDTHLIPGLGRSP